jgi:hypothetical protein
LRIILESLKKTEELCTKPFFCTLHRLPLILRHLLLLFRRSFWTMEDAKAVCFYLMGATSKVTACTGCHVL